MYNCISAQIYQCRYIPVHIYIYLRWINYLYAGRNPTQLTGHLKEYFGQEGGLRQTSLCSNSSTTMSVQYSIGKNAMKSNE